MSDNQTPEFVLNENWKLALKKSLLVLSCMALSYFSAVFVTILYYFFYTSLNDVPQEYPGMDPWQPFWSIALLFGFLFGLFKSILDIIDQKFVSNNQQQTDDSTN